MANFWPYNLCLSLGSSSYFFLIPQGRKHNYEVEKRNAVTLTTENFKSRINKTTALSDKNHRFVPFFGSSEWLRFDALHPAVLAEKYDRNYAHILLDNVGLPL